MEVEKKGEDSYLGGRSHARPTLQPNGKGGMLGVLTGLEEPEKDVPVVGCILGTGGEADVAGVGLHAAGGLADIFGLATVSSSVSQGRRAGEEEAGRYQRQVGEDWSRGCVPL